MLNLGFNLLSDMSHCGTKREDNRKLEVLVYLGAGHLARSHWRSPKEKNKHKDDKVKELAYGTEHKKV